MLQSLFTPARISSTLKRSFKNSQLGYQIELNEKDNITPAEADLVIAGIPEARGFDDNAGAAKACDTIRKALYRLYTPQKKIKITDLGNLKCGERLGDTYSALKDVILYFREKNIPLIILGGTHDLISVQSGACKNTVIIDEKINDDIIRTSGNISYIGYQTYLTDPNVLEKIEKKGSELIRLGRLREDITESEPHIREADAFAFNICAVRQSDAPGYCDPSPNGLYGEEACTLTRYSGLSQSVSSFGIYNLNPGFDNNEQTSQLAAQMIWYFIEGFYLRNNDDPRKDKANFIKYFVSLKEGDNKITFLKSKKTERWWMESSDNKAIPCSYNDYLLACRNELPDRYLKLLI